MFRMQFGHKHERGGPPVGVTNLSELRFSTPAFDTSRQQTLRRFLSIPAILLSSSYPNRNKVPTSVCNSNASSYELAP